MGVDNPIKWVLITMPNIPLRMGIDQHPAPMMIGGTWDKEQHQENRVRRSMSIGEVEHMEHGSWRRCSCNNKAEEHEHDHKHEHKFPILPSCVWLIFKSKVNSPVSMPSPTFL